MSLQLSAQLQSRVSCGALDQNRAMARPNHVLARFNIGMIQIRICFRMTTMQIRMIGTLLTCVVIYKQGKVDTNSHPLLALRVQDRLMVLDPIRAIAYL
jgi:hypothetical protein